MNPAIRLLHTYDQLRKTPNDWSVEDAWGHIFEISKNQPNRVDDLTACLLGLRSEIDAVTQRLIALAVNPDLVDPGFANLKSVASPTYLNQAWAGVRGHIDPPECRHAFKWVAWVLRAEPDDDVTSEDRVALLAAIQSLEETLMATDLQPFIREFALRQINAIRLALRDSKVKGMRTLQDATTMILGDYRLNLKTLRESAKNASSSDKKTLKDLSELITTTGNTVDAYGRLIEVAHDVGGAINDVLTNLATSS